MRLKKLLLAGFKSFVEPTTITLPGDLVGIVGPNGCGKSNVIDAVRWVMGFAPRFDKKQCLRFDKKQCSTARARRLAPEQEGHLRHVQGAAREGPGHAGGRPAQVLPPLPGCGRGGGGGAESHGR